MKTVSYISHKWNRFKKSRAFKRLRAECAHLDFKHRCVFEHQVASIGCKTGQKIKGDDIIVVPMVSGERARYRVRRDTNGFGGTGQANYYYEFIGYIESKECTQNVFNC